MESIINGLVNAGTTIGIIILTTAFLLMDAANIPGKMNSELETQSELQLRMSKFVKNLVGFIVIRAETKVPLQKILKLKQNFSFTSKNIKKQNIS